MLTQEENIKYRQHLGTQLRELRESRMMTLENVEQSTGLKPYFMKELESGKINCRLDKIFLLRKLYGETIEL